MTKNPDSTPIWVFIFFSAVSYIVFPRIRKHVSRYVSDDEKQSLCTYILCLVVGAIAVTISMIF